jgi:hypothetical protein
VFLLALSVVACGGGGAGGEAVASDAAVDASAVQEAAAETGPGDAATGRDASSPAPDAGVSDAADAGLPDEICSPLTAHADEIVDATTGLRWARHIAGPAPFATGTSICQAWGGRIPSPAEIKTLMIAFFTCASKDGGVTLTWDGPPSGETMWSSAVDPLNSAFHECVLFDSLLPDGGLDLISSPAGDGHWIRCVR